MEKSVAFYSDGLRLAGVLWVPDDYREGERRAGIVVCQGYTGPKELYMPDIARKLTQAGYIALIFDYRWYSESEGRPLRLDPHGRVEDARNALTFLSVQPQVDESRLGLYGTSYGGAIVTYAAAVDSRVRCTVSTVGVGDGERWMRSIRRPGEWYELLKRLEEDRRTRVVTGESRLVPKTDILPLDPEGAQFSARARANLPVSATELPLDYADAALSFKPEWVVDKIAPRAVLFIAAEMDATVPPEQAKRMYDRAQEPKKLIVLPGAAHYSVYEEPTLTVVTDYAIQWYDQYLGCVTK